MSEEKKSEEKIEKGLFQAIIGRGVDAFSEHIAELLTILGFDALALWKKGWDESVANVIIAALIYILRSDDVLRSGRTVKVISIALQTLIPLPAVLKGKRDEVFSSWKAQLTELARSENVNLKLGGMMMRLAAFDYRTAPRPPSSADLAALWRPYIETGIELFGPSRCLVESNFPVDKMGIGWAAYWNALKRLTAGASPVDKQTMFSGTARRVYRLT